MLSRFAALSVSLTWAITRAGNTCQADEEYEMGSANVNDCLTCQQGYRFVLQFPGDCTGTCEPVLDNAAHYVSVMRPSFLRSAASLLLARLAPLADTERAATGRWHEHQQRERR